MFLLTVVRSGFGMEDQGPIFNLHDGKSKSKKSTQCIPSISLLIGEYEVPA